MDETESNELSTPPVKKENKSKKYLAILVLLIFLLSIIGYSIFAADKQTTPVLDNSIDGTQPVLLNDTCGRDGQEQCDPIAASSTLKINIIEGNETN